MILTVLLLVVGLVLGTLVGTFMAGEEPVPEDMAAEADMDADAKGDMAASSDGEKKIEHAEVMLSDHGRGSLEEEGAGSVVALNRRIIVPVIVGRETQALVLFDLALEVPVDSTELTHSAMPRLRDAFLRTLLEFAATGAFANGTSDPQLIERIRVLLWRRAVETLPFDEVNVLILEALVREI